MLAQRSRKLMSLVRSCVHAPTSNPSGVTPSLWSYFADCRTCGRAFDNVHMDALRSRLRLAPGIKNIGGTGQEGKVMTRKKCCFINELPFASRDTGQPWLQEISGAFVPVILAAAPDLTANHPVRSAKFPVISAGTNNAKPLNYLIKFGVTGRFQARRRRKCRVIETRSRQTGSTANPSARAGWIVRTLQQGLKACVCGGHVSI